MKIVDQISKDELNAFLFSQKYCQFLQSWQWGEFQKKNGNEVIRLAVKKEDQIVAVVSIIKKALPLNSFYFFCPRGPVVSSKNEDEKLAILEFVYAEIIKLARKQKVIFFRFEPVFEIKSLTVHAYNAQKSLNLKIEKSIDLEPKKTLVLNLEPDETDLLKSMHQKTRYNIRLAEKKGVKIVVVIASHFDDFWKLVGETSGRDSFRPHSISYYREMINLDERFIKMYVASYKNKIIAANIVSFFGDTVTYIHGTSSNEHRNMMAPYFLQWHCIKEAKSQGYKYYDFYGIDEKKWPGVTKFKRGFGGEKIEYPGTLDLIVANKWYNIYKLVRKLRRAL